MGLAARHFIAFAAAAVALLGLLFYLPLAASAA